MAESNQWAMITKLQINKAQCDFVGGFKSVDKARPNAYRVGIDVALMKDRS
jgi:hypothetical protein